MADEQVLVFGSEEDQYPGHGEPTPSESPLHGEDIPLVKSTVPTTDFPRRRPVTVTSTACRRFCCHFRALICLHLQTEKNHGGLAMACYIGFPLCVLLGPSLISLLVFILSLVLKNPLGIAYNVQSAQSVTPYLNNEDWEIVHCEKWNPGRSVSWEEMMEIGVVEMHSGFVNYSTIGIIARDDQVSEIGWMGGGGVNPWGILGNASLKQFPSVVLDNCHGSDELHCPVCSWSPAFERISPNPQQSGGGPLHQPQFDSARLFGIVDVGSDPGLHLQEGSIAARIYQVPASISGNTYSQGSGALHLVMSAVVNSVTMGRKEWGSRAKPYVAVSGEEVSIQRIDPLASLRSTPNIAFLFSLPIALSFLFPRVAVRVVAERRKGLTRYLRLFGVSSFVNELSRVAYDYGYYFLFMVISIAIPAACQAEFFVKGNPLQYISLFLIWGLVLVSGAYVFSLLHANEAIAAANGYLLLFTSVWIGGCINFIFNSQTLPPFYYMLYPPFAFIRGFVYIMASYNPSSLRAGEPYYFWICIAYLAGSAIVLLLIYALVRFEFFEWLYVRVKMCCNRRKDFARARSSYGADAAGSINSEDSDCVEEKSFVLGQRSGSGSSQNHLLSIRGLSKSFGSRRVVDDVFLTVKQSECFGLLGPNGQSPVQFAAQQFFFFAGAGKTTLLKLLTGELTPSGGSGSVDGLDCTLQRSEVLKRISIVPQFDCLFDALTVAETLFFFTRLRGHLAVKEEAAYVEAIMEQVNLGDFQRQLVKNLSGGSKRRLSLGVALCGEPRLLFMDEPSTGLDPASRRGLWEVIERIKQTTTILITTHSMHEAERLCDRIAIMSKGRFRCIGDLMHLKDKFGRGFELSIHCSTEFRSIADAYVREVLPAVSECHVFSDTMVYRIPSSEIRFSSLFELLDDDKLRGRGIRNWTVNQASLEEVFMRIVKDDEERLDAVAKGCMYYLFCCCFCDRCRRDHSDENGVGVLGDDENIFDRGLLHGTRQVEEEEEGEIAATMT